MQDYNLLNPGLDQAAQTLRKAVAAAISNAEGVTNPNPALATFLQDAATKTPGYVAAPLPATQAIVTTGNTLPVKNSAGTVTKNGTATVAANAVTGVALPATSAIVDNGASAVLRTSGGLATGSTVTATVAGGLLSNVRLSAITGVVVNAVKVSGITVSGTGPVVTFTVADGVITGITLSES